MPPRLLKIWRKQNGDTATDLIADGQGRQDLRSLAVRQLRRGEHGGNDADRRMHVGPVEVVIVQRVSRDPVDQRGHHRPGSILSTDDRALRRRTVG